MGCLSLCSLSLDPPFPYLFCLVGPQWERMCLDLLGLDAQGGVVPKGDMGEIFVRVGLGREEGGEL